MSWLVSLFSSARNSNSRKAMSSAGDAFSLPISSPPSLHPDAFNGDALNTPDQLDSATSYSYPPISTSPSYDYIPTSYV